jgi:hypothetical protein
VSGGPGGAPAPAAPPPGGAPAGGPAGGRVAPVGGRRCSPLAWGPPPARGAGGGGAGGAPPHEGDADQCLGQVGAQREVGCRDFAAGGVEQPNLAVVAHQNGARGEPAMGDLVGPEPGDLLPQVDQQLVGDLVGRHVGQGPAGHVVVHEQGRVGAEPHDVA